MVPGRSRISPVGDRQVERRDRRRAVTQIATMKSKYLAGADNSMAVLATRNGNEGIYGRISDRSHTSDQRRCGKTLGTPTDRPRTEILLRGGRTVRSSNETLEPGSVTFRVKASRDSKGIKQLFRKLIISFLKILISEYILVRNNVSTFLDSNDGRQTAFINSSVKPNTFLIIIYHLIMTTIFLIRFFSEIFCSEFCNSISYSYLYKSV